jgi:hypothetical protein
MRIDPDCFSSDFDHCFQCAAPSRRCSSAKTSQSATFFAQTTAAPG